MPLCNFFAPADWALMTLAFELHQLTHSFKSDAKDETRAGIHLDHLDFYYQKYFQKALTPKSFGVETVQAVVDLVKDVVHINGKGQLVSMLSEEMESYQIFVMITEEARRYRSLRIDVGDESAVLKIAVQHGSQQQQNGHKRKGEWKDWKQPQAVGAVGKGTTSKGATGKGATGKGATSKGGWQGQSWANKKPRVWTTK
ncbi:unnamed protein product [Prorocentrum cordatum]|uniref:Uncharacterized protein n=1 Tax=Prorocentrum cordatum TaxID=2364126 RepID=A0ABN9VUK9_9DINO|nr:unnamed protein product [Polarella glacialis]